MNCLNHKKVDGLKEKNYYEAMVEDRLISNTINNYYSER